MIFLTERIKLDEKIGVIGPIVLLVKEPIILFRFMVLKQISEHKKRKSIFLGKKLTNELPTEIYVDYVLGGAMMIRSSVLKIIGLFEEDYFMYNDEIDLAYRIKKAGFKTLCMRDAIVRHFHDFNKKNKRK